MRITGKQTIILDKCVRQSREELMHVFHISSIVQIWYLELDTCIYIYLLFSNY